MKFSALFNFSPYPFLSSKRWPFNISLCTIVADQFHSVIFTTMNNAQLKRGDPGWGILQLVWGYFFFILKLGTNVNCGLMPENGNRNGEAKKEKKTEKWGQVDMMDGMVAMHREMWRRTEWRDDEVGQMSLPTTFQLVLPSTGWSVTLPQELAHVKGLLNRTYLSSLRNF